MAGPPVARVPAKPAVAPARSLSPTELKAARRRVVTYIARARVPIRQAAAARQLWIGDLSKVYDAIRTSPTHLILERAGEVGFRHEPAFRDALSLAQAIDPPPEAETVHAALIGWLTTLHAACLALIDARRLKDRSLLGNFREHLSQARRHAAALAAERAALFTDYQLRFRPTIKARRARPAPGDEQREEVEETAAAQPESRGARGGRRPGGTSRSAPAESRGARRPGSPGTRDRARPRPGGGGGRSRARPPG